MNCRITCDAFVHKLYLKEDFSSGSWSEDELDQDAKDNGTMFLPSSNLLYQEFEEERDLNLLYAITTINGQDEMLSVPNIGYEEAAMYINIFGTNLHEDDISYIGIYRMKDGLSFTEYQSWLVNRPSLNEQLGIAIEIAVLAHRGQVDKGGHPYIMHCIQVMNSVNDIKEKIVGILHDVVEDTKVTLQDLCHKGFEIDIISGVDAITKRPKETYDQSLYRVFVNKLARNPKIGDMTTNSDLDRIANPSVLDYERSLKYKRGIRILTEGNWRFNGTVWEELQN